MANFCLEIQDFFKSKIFENLPGEMEFFLVQLPDKIEIFRKSAWKNQSFFSEIA